MTTTTYSGPVNGPIVVNNGDEADLNGAALTSNSNGVQGLGTVTVKLVGSTIMSTNRGVTDDASGLLTVSVDQNSSITGKDGIGSSFAPIALTNAGTIQTNQSGFSGVAISQNSNGSTVVNSGVISGGGVGDYAINANGTAVVTNSGTITAGTFGALRFSDRGGTLNLSNGGTAGVINGGIVVDGGPLTLSTNGVANYTLASAISGNGSLLVNSPFTMKLSCS